MKHALLLLAFAAAAAACAHQHRQAALEELSHLCLGRAMHAEALLAPDAPEQARRELAFKNYYESFLDAKEQGAYVDCLGLKWRAPWLHAEYRTARRWLKMARKEERDNAPLAGPDKKIADVTEAFEKKDSQTSLRRVTITLASGAKTTVEETFPTTPESGL